MTQSSAQLALAALMSFVALPGTRAYANDALADSTTETYELEGVYTTDFWRNSRGGLQTGNVRLDNVDLTLSVDGARAWGLEGVSAFAHLLHNNGAKFSEKYVGDAMVVSNIEGVDALRLYEAWVQWENRSRTFSMRVGLYDLNSEFDTLNSRALFIGSTHGVGHELAQTGLNGPSIFPVTSLALRAAWSPTQRSRVLAAAFDGVPGDPEHPASNRIHVGGDDGVLGIVELQWLGDRFRKLAVGHWRYSAEFADLLVNQDSVRGVRDDNRGTYAQVEIALEALADESPDSLAFVRYGVANDRINEYADSWSAGIRHRGLFASRPDDETGLAYARTRVGKPAALSAEPRDDYEAVIELTYRAAITPWLTVQPDIQFIVNPSANLLLKDSLAIGIRLEFAKALQW